MTTSENTQRDQLAQIVYLSTYPDPTSKGIQPLAERAKWEQDSHRGAADAILAAGYRKPCTITTVEDLDALPFRSVILDDMERAFQRWNLAGWQKAGPSIAAHEPRLPARVLFDPRFEAAG